MTACSDCGATPLFNRGRCEPCFRAHARAYRKALYQSRKLAGLCIQCGATLQEDDNCRCVECQAKDVASRAKYRQNNRQKDRAWHRGARARRRAAGLCGTCPEPAVPGHAMCAGHLAYHRRYARAWVRERRAQERAGITPIDRRKIAREPEPAARVNVVLDGPADAVMSAPRSRILRAMRFLDWTPVKELFDLLGVAWTDAEQREWEAYMQHVVRLVKLGLAEARGRRGGRDYRLTALGKAEAARIVTSTIREAA